jgi:hypothetical protein
MSNSITGKQVKNIAIRVPAEVARAARLAADEIVTESRNYSLGEVSIRKLLDEARRG